MAAFGMAVPSVAFFDIGASYAKTLNFYPEVMAVSSPLGISVRFIRQYDMVQDVSPQRLDVLFGMREVMPELALEVKG